ncbi:hypothetical protein SUGI_0717890 [Cryptomeria japonica]|nr:hypothetical protein SUGI_0717890 [Cryptomeria japonica]
MRNNTQKEDSAKSNRWSFANLRFDGPFDFKRIEKKFWRNRSLDAGSSNGKTFPVIKHTIVESLSINSQAWNELDINLKERAFFLKWTGPWPNFRQVREWCNAHWGKMVLKTLPNGFYLVNCPTAKDKEWIFNSGPYMMGGKGFYLKDWTPNFNPKEEAIMKTPMWIRLYNLPHEYYNIETLQ